MEEPNCVPNIIQALEGLDARPIQGDWKKVFFDCMLKCPRWQNAQVWQNAQGDKTPKRYYAHDDNMSKKSFCPRWQNAQIVMCLAYLFWYISLDYSIMFFFKSIMPNIQHNIKIICEIHIAYRYFDPSNRHNKEENR